MLRACPRCSSLYASHFEYCGIDGSALIETENDPLLGQTLDRYVIVERLGQGAMGCVYKAKHAVLPKQYAIKILYGEFASNKTLVARFRREAEAASHIKHPNVVEVVDFGVSDNGLTFLVMEFLLGETLDLVLKRGGALPVPRAASLAQQVASGLAALHEKGYVHRDLKPANVLLVRDGSEERAKILDFGIVGVVDAEESNRLTQTGKLLGTPLYMAPEQVGSTAAAFSVDLYALGCIVYEMLAGHPPFIADKLADLLRKHAQEAPAPLPHGQGLDALAMRLLAKDPLERPPSARAVVEEIDAIRANWPAPEPLVHPAAVDDMIAAVQGLGRISTETRPQEVTPRPRERPRSSPRLTASRIETDEQDELSRPRSRSAPMLTIALILACLAAVGWLWSRRAALPATPAATTKDAQGAAGASARPGALTLGAAPAPADRDA